MRLFFALLPPYALHSMLREIMHGVAGARWQSADQLHLTLRFVGEVSTHQADELAAMLPRAVMPVPPLTLSGLGMFESGGYHHSLWIRAARAEPLAAFHRKLDRLCQSVGLKAEGRAYLPHVTLARLPRSAGPVEGWLADHAGRSFGPTAFPRCALVESQLSPEGSTYHQLTSVRLG